MVQVISKNLHLQNLQLEQQEQQRQRQHYDKRKFVKDFWSVKTIISTLTTTTTTTIKCIGHRTKIWHLCECSSDCCKLNNKNKDNNNNHTNNSSGISVSGIRHGWAVLIVFMLILCGNCGISQQQQQQQQNNNKNNLLQVSRPTPATSTADITQTIRKHTNTTNNQEEGENEAAAAAAAAARKHAKITLANKVAIKATPTNATHKIITKTSTSTSISSSSSSSSISSSSSSASSSLSSASYPSAGNSTNLLNTTITAEAAAAKATDNNASALGSSSAIFTSDRLSEISKRNGESYNTINYRKNNRNNHDKNNKISKKDEEDDNDENDNDDDDDDDDEETEMLNESEDGYESFSTTTTKPAKPSLAPHNSAQERERRLMNVLAARRNALHRAGVRSRVITTSRTATAMETTSRTPTDPRSICIRNCTKNFTRRTTASCMRQCSNFSRKSDLKQNFLKAESKAKVATEKDTNEILFSDESSHSVLVIAKEQNDTLNHIPDEKKSGSGLKLRGNRRKGSALNTVTVASTSIEDDDIQPYLYFGQKLPPLKPNTLTITAVNEEHPKLLEVAVAKDFINATTTPASSKSSIGTLSAVERSRARFKYNMRGGVSFNRRYSPFTRMPLNEIKASSLANIVATTAATTAAVSSELSANQTNQMENLKNLNTTVQAEQIITSSTPLIITVLSEDDIITTVPPFTGNTVAITNMNVTTTVSTTEKFTHPASPITSTTTTTTTRTTTTTPKTSTLPATTTSTMTTQSTTSSPATTKRAFTSTSTMGTSNTVTSTRNIIEEDRELLRALGPSLTQTNDQPNLVIFVNRTSDMFTPSEPPFSTTSTSKRPRKYSVSYNTTTESSPIIVRTTVLTSVRSTVNVNMNEKLPSTTEASSTLFYTKPSLIEKPGSFIVDYDTKNNDQGSRSSSTTSQPIDISSTVVTNEKEISTEMQRMNIVTIVLAGIGIVPLMAVILYLVRNYILKRPLKDDEDFDVCITDQQPISPVKKLDTKYHINNGLDYDDDDDGDGNNVNGNDDQVDHRKPPQRQHSQVHKLVFRDQNYNTNHMHQSRFNDDKSSIISDREFDRSNIRLKSLLGEGNFGQVWKAEADDLSGHFGATRIVAVKTIRACSTQASLKDEGNIMRKLGSHTNVVTLLGACVETEPHMLIMEYAMRGRLLSLLRAARNATNILPASVPGGRSQTPLSPRTLAGFCLDIACGMEYIAGKRIVHRDLAARNVLLDHNGICKICDFGMSIDLDAERKRKTYEKNCANEIMRSNFNKFKFDFGGKFIINHWPQNAEKDTPNHHVHQIELNKKVHHGHDTIGRRPALPIRWMAPEALQYHVFTRETDIWAFGIVLWEIATLGCTPYSHLTGREVIRRVPLGLRPDLPKEGRHEFYNLMSRCWHKDPQMRPSFSQSRLEITRSLHQWVDDDTASNSDYMDVSGFSEDLEHGMVYFNHRISEFECEI